MARDWFTNDEPLTLLTRPDLAGIYHREEILRQRAVLSLPRLRVDPWIAKVLPRGSIFHLEPTEGPLHQVLDCEYRPFFQKALYALPELCRPIPKTQRPSRPLPSVDTVRERLLRRVGTRYLFGGSAASGSHAQARLLIQKGLFLEEDRLDDDLDRLMRSAGIDCSGLFNEATGYHFFGDSKDVYAHFQESLIEVTEAAASDPARLAKELRPCDVILMRGHVMMALGDGRIIQSVGDGPNALAFAHETAHRGAPMTKYDRVVVDDAEPILRALLIRQGRTLTPKFLLSDRHIMIVRVFP